MLGAIPDYESAEAPVADEDVGAKAQDEIGEPGLAGGHDCGGEVVGGVGFIIEVRRTSYFEGGVWS